MILLFPFFFVYQVTLYLRMSNPVVAGYTGYVLFFVLGVIDYHTFRGSNFPVKGMASFTRFIAHMFGVFPISIYWFFETTSKVEIHFLKRFNFMKQEGCYVPFRVAAIACNLSMRGRFPSLDVSTHLVAYITKTGLRSDGNCTQDCKYKKEFKHQQSKE